MSTEHTLTRINDELRELNIELARTRNLYEDGVDIDDNRLRYIQERINHLNDRKFSLSNVLLG